MKQTAIDWLIEKLAQNGVLHSSDIHQAKEMEKQQMLEFGSKITDRWGLTKVEPHYIEDEYNKQYKSK